MSSDAPRPSSADLTGSWMAVPDGAAPGPVERDPPCYEGIQLLTLVQRGAHVDAVWYTRGRTEGPIPPYWVAADDASSGTYSDGRLHLEGVLSIAVGLTGSQARSRECYAVESDLHFDEASGQLVGTRDGAAVRYAPVVFRTEAARQEPCGPAPQ